MNNKKHYWRTALVVAAIALVVVAGASFIVSEVLERKIMQLGKTAAQNLTLEKVRVNLLTRNITIRGLTWEESQNGSQIEIPKLRLHRVRIIPALFKKHYNIQKVSVSGSGIQFVSKNENNEPTQEKNRKAQQLPSVEIGQLEISDALFMVSDSDSTAADTLISGRCTLHLNRLKTRDSTLHYSIGNIGFNELTLEVKALRYHFPNGLYRVQADHFTYESQHEKGLISGFSLESLYPKYEIGQHTGVETDWYQLNTDSILLNKLSLAAAFHDSAFRVAEMELRNNEFAIFRDKRLPFPEKPDTKLPAASVNIIPFGFHIDELKLANTNITYQEHWENSDVPGEVRFNQLDAKISSISNREDWIKTKTQIEATCRLFNEADCTVQFTFPNKKYAVPNRVKGHLGAMPLKPFGSMFRASAATNLESGNIDQLDFEFTYNNDQSDGRLNFQYHDLKVSVFEPDDGDTQKVKSFFLNTFVVRAQNPGENGKVRTGNVAFERYKKKSIFNYWWKSVLSGIKDVVAGT